VEGLHPVAWGVRGLRRSGGTFGYTDGDTSTLETGGGFAADRGLKEDSDVSTEMGLSTLRLPNYPQSVFFTNLIPWEHPAPFHRQAGAQKGNPTTVYS
jgi:hypothetical protein